MEEWWGSKAARAIQPKSKGRADTAKCISNKIATQGGGTVEMSMSAVGKRAEGEKLANL